LNNQTLGLKIWYQEADRQVPPTLLTNTSEDRQKDISLRTVALWSLVQEQMVWKARTAFFVESLRFQNQLIDSYSFVLSSITEAENKWYIHPLHQLLTGLNFRFSSAVSDGYKQQTQQLRGAIFAAYQYHTRDERFRTHLRLRAEMVDEQLVRPATSLGLIWRFYQSLKAKLQVSNNYRLPTFNDLYWNVLGNPELKPEYSWNSEIGLQLPIAVNKTSLEANISLFSNWVDDWILWSPNSAGLWRPENVDKVWARGIEADLDLLYRVGQWQIGLTINYAYTRSTRTAGDKPETIGKQLIYIPDNQLNTQLSLQFKSTRLSYQHQVISARFIDKLNLEELPLYQLGHVQLEHSFNLKKAQLTSFVRIANIFGTNYQIIPMRAMPWQQFELGLRINLNEKPKT
jgi:iron complex outermembrane receptor protein